MKIKLELYGASREFSKKGSEENNIVADNYKITKDQKIGIIPPIGGG